MTRKRQPSTHNELIDLKKAFPQRRIDDWPDLVCDICGESINPFIELKIFGGLYVSSLAEVPRAAHMACRYRMV